MRNGLFYSFALSLLWIFSSCQKEATPGSAIQYLRKTTVTTADSVYNTTYTYDNQNRIISISRSFNQGQGEQDRFDITYDAQGKMASANHTPYGTLSFEYDNQNRIVQKLQTSSSTYPGRSTYSYDTKGRLIADTTYSYWVNEVFEYTTYNYDQNDNIIEVKVFRNNAGVFYVERTMQLQFDNKTNPYYASLSVLYFISDDGNGKEYLLSRNNSIKEIFPNGDVISYNYVYAGDLPKRVAITDSSDPGWILNEEFYY